MEKLAAKVAEILTEMQTPADDPVAMEYSGRAADHLKIAHDLLVEGAKDVAERKRVADELAKQAAEQAAQPEAAAEA
jgi:hypothetical protein